MDVDKILVVQKRSAYEIYCEQERDPRILQLVAENHPSIQDLRKSHNEHRDTLERVGNAIEALKLKATFLRRDEVRSVAAGDHDLVITVGGDGTFLETSHHVREIPMLGVNSSPSVSSGLLLGATGKTLQRVLGSIRKGTLKPVVLNRMGLNLNGNQMSEPVLNEVLIAAQNPAATSRYILELGKKREDQRSSGVYVGTGAGSMAVMRAAGAKQLPLGSKQIQYLVRAPHRGPGRKPTAIRGTIAPKSPLRLHSKMRHGMIFVDGTHVRYRFDYGDKLEFIPNFTPLTVFGVTMKKG